MKTISAPNPPTYLKTASGYYILSLSLLLCICSFSHAGAQADIHFSQFYETSVLRNPALTGVFADDFKVGVYYRNQWSSITNPFSTSLLSAETRFSVKKTSNDFISFGLLAYNDKAGSIDQSITAVYPAVNYNKSLNPDHNSYLSVGFTGGYMQYSFDPSKATFNNQYVGGSYNASNPTGENLPNPKMTMFDLGAGINYNTSRGEYNTSTYVIGFSGYHFTQPNFSYYATPSINQNIRWNANIAASYTLSESVGLQLHGNYAQQGPYQEIMVGGMINWTALTDGPKTIFTMSGGVFYRYDDAIIPVVKVKYKGMAAAVSYDLNVSTLKEASNLQGGYEFTLFYSGNYSNKNEVLKKTVCPKF
jgi:type IX secretion system PorP/SprF family membrane protein